MEKVTRLSSGSKVFDDLLNGGFEHGVISTVYGESGSGKTNVALIFALAAAKKGLKVAYIDTEGGFSAERVKQIAPDLDILKNIEISTPTTFEEQGKALREIREPVREGKIQVIVIDSFTMLYRLERPDNPEEVNHELTKQCSILSSLARKNNIPILVTNQVYSKFDEPHEVKPVGGDILKYWSKCILKLSKAGLRLRNIELIKHRSIPEGKKNYFRIVSAGIEEEEKPKEKRKFMI